MPRKKMPTPDAALKDFFTNNEVFADVFNTFLFKEDVIVPSELQPANTAYSDTVKTTKGVEKIGKYRDNIRRTALGAQFVILGIEDQNKIHYAMPVRNMLYDALGYSAECKSLGTIQDNNDWIIDEFLSKLSKGTMLTPILTIVFYTGESVWDSPRSLHDMLSIDEKLREYIPDYPMNIIDLGHDDIAFRNDSLKELAYVLKGIYDKSLINDTTEVSNATLNLAAILTNVPKLYGKKEGGKTIMCNAMKEILAEERMLVYFENVRDGDMTIKRAAEKSKMSLKEFEKEMKKWEKTLLTK